MSIGTDGFRPRGPWRNPHVQTIAASSPLRRAWVRRRATDLRRRARQVLVDAGGGVRLSGRHTPRASGTLPRGLAVMLHGWEGSSESSYVLESGARLLAEGWDVFRLNLRDHGGSHALNPALFHSGLVDEVVAAVARIAAEHAPRPLVLLGFSLGGNFALRVALRAPAAGIALARVLAVAPVVDPARSMRALEDGLPVYSRYFMHQWCGSLRRKQRAFPQTRYFDSHELRLGLRELTRVLVQRHTDYGTLDNYLDAYSIAGDRLATLQVPAAILAARDDPVIPVVDFEALAALPALRVEFTDHGGHCAFLHGLRGPSFSALWLAARAGGMG
ncbi:MAG TPA: alpha/beta fold hydrolase [Rhodanobacteraceae bacterium]|nr:alpha/beta fold hydrolase [Rhodanobacteraceae bacterium]